LPALQQCRRYGSSTLGIARHPTPSAAPRPAQEELSEERGSSAEEVSQRLLSAPGLAGLSVRGLCLFLEQRVARRAACRRGVQACLPLPPVPVGFCITTHAYADFLHGSALAEAIYEKVNSIDCANVAELDKVSEEVRGLVLVSPLPSEVEHSIKASYHQLCALAGATNDLPVAVRSSATAEDLPDASFAGQQDTYLWVVGEEEVIEHVRRCWASLYTSRAINYRRNQQIKEDEVLMSVVIQKMVNARTAGVAMTLNPTNGDRSQIVIDAS